MTMTQDLQFQLGDDGVALLSIDVAGKPMNVFTDDLREALRAAIERIATDAAIRGAVITSAKADFMAGADIKAMVAWFETFEDPQRVYREVARPLTELLRRLETCGKPFAAAINGVALGGGLELTLACHHRVVADDPKLVLSLPEVGIGLIPGAGGTQRLPRLIGIQKAVPLMLQGTRLSPAEALQLGVVHAVVPPAQLIAAARQWVLEQGDAVQPWDRKNFELPGGAGPRAPGLASFYNLTATQIAVSTQHNNPAPIGLLNAVARGTVCPIDAGLRIESRQFTQLLMNPVARNMMRTLFVSKGQCEKLARRPAQVAPARFTAVGVIGAGLMGAGIAQASAQAGLEVVLIDATPAQAEAAKQRLAEAFARQVQKGRMKAEQAESVLARIHPSATYGELARCELVVEAVFEDRKLKAEVFRKARALMNPEAILASNTSSLPVTGLAAGVDQPARFIGLHFFSPVDRMALVEVVRGTQTSDETLARALDYIKRLRKTPIVVNDAHGFFTTRVIGAYINESLGMLAEGIVPALIDNAAKLAGLPIGPLALVDELTIELGYHAARQYREDAGDRWIEGYGFQVQKKFVDELQRRGKRYGAGFYDYIDGRRQPWPGLAEVYPPQAEQPQAAEVRTRMLVIQALEAARAFEEGVVTDPGEADVGAVLGIGFPAYTGGPFSMIDTQGLPAFVETCDQLAVRYGARYRPSAWLRQRATAGQRFYGSTA